MGIPGATDRLAFAEMTPGDLEEMAELLGDATVMRFYERPFTRPETQRWIDWNRRLYSDVGHGLWLLRLRQTGEFVGDCGLTPQRLDGRTYVEVGYHVATALQGQGLATEAAIACREFAARTLELKYLVAIVHPANAASQRVAAKVGLHHEWSTHDAQGRLCRVYAGNPGEGHPLSTHPTER